MSPTEEFWWNWGVNAAVAIATFGAVAAALFGSKFLRPRLRVDVPNRFGVLIPKRSLRYYHVRVINVARWRPATQVQIHLLRVEAPGPGGKLQTKWEGEVPLIWSLPQIRPKWREVGPEAVCDLCSVTRDQGLAFQLQIVPYSLEEIVKRQSAFDIVVTLQARSIEADSPVLRVQIAWNGIWADGDAEMAKNLITTPLPECRSIG